MSATALHAKTALGLLSAMLLPAIGGAIVEPGETSDPCETKALKAYWDALRLCQIEGEINPRLKCYEAAKTVYRETFLKCKDSSDVGK